MHFCDSRVYDREEKTSNAALHLQDAKGAINSDAVENSLFYDFETPIIDQVKSELQDCSKESDEPLVHPRAKTRLRTKMNVQFHRGSRYRGVS